MAILKIYTDGACSGNQHDENIGGWGAVLTYGSHEKELWGGQRNTTNNRMEMTALLEAFRAINRDNQCIEIYSDSAYLMDCFRKKWYVKWLSNGWINSKKEPVENRDLWEVLLPFLQTHDIRFYRVKGHVNLASKSLNKESLYRQFVEWNGNEFRFEDFLLVTRMNHRADELANRGIDEIRSAV
jgi:ribonuclease HI